MRFIAYTHAYPGMGHIAGSESSLHDLCKILKNQGHDVAVLVGTELAIPNYTWDDIPVFTCQSHRDVKTLPQELFPLADAVITQNSLSHRGSILGRMLGKPIIHYVHNDSLHAEKMAWQFTDLVIYNTDWIKEKFESRGMPTPGVVLHPAVDPEQYKIRRNRGSKYITLVNLSRGNSTVTYDKGWRTFFELARRNPHEAFLGVRGAYGDQAFEDLPNVHYMDHTEDIRKAYEKSRVVVVPSRYESFGRVSLEAAASGIPSILTPTPGTREAMGTSAMYADFEEFDDWNISLHEMLNQWDKHSEVAKKRSAFVWERTQQEIEELGVVMSILESEGLKGLKGL
jgi:glycosyltransferase involved in cell wall biosynthesis